MTRFNQIALGLCLSCCSVQLAHAGGFVFAGEANGIDVVTHPTTYTGSGGTAVVNVCIVPGSPNAAAMEIPVQNIVQRVNQFQAQQPNLQTGNNNNIPPGQFDFESVALHEVGHCLGLAHPNLGSRTGVSGADTNYTASTDGVNDTFNLNASTDGVIGSNDDIRGDDANLHWFFINENNPFEAPTLNVDDSNYSRDLVDLPIGDTYVANASRQLASNLGYGATEAVMQQGTPPDEAQRSFAVDDIATFSFARSGVDQTAGTGDDYDVQLVYGGISDAASCDINLEFDNLETGFAVCKLQGVGLAPNHFRISQANAFFNDSAVTWFFNDVAGGLIFSDSFEL